MRIGDNLSEVSFLFSFEIFRKPLKAMLDHTFPAIEKSYLIA